MLPIQKYRELAGFKTAGAAARQLRLEPSLYRRIERGIHKPGADTLIILAKGFGCTSDELLGLNGEASA